MKRNQLFPKIVYVIILDEKPIYVGSTFCTLKKRIAEHRCSRTYPILRERREDIEIFEIDTITCSYELWKENYWVQYYRSLGYNIINKATPLFLDYISTGKQTKKTYNKEYATEYYRQWRERNHEKYTEYQRNYKRAHKN